MARGPRYSRFPAPVALELQNALNAIIDELVSESERVLDLIKLDYQALVRDRALSFANRHLGLDRIERALEELREKLIAVTERIGVYNAIKKVTELAARKALKDIESDIKRVVRKPDLTLIFPDKAIRAISEARIRATVSTVKTIPVQFHEALVRTIYDAATAGKSYADLAKDIRAIYDTTRARAQTIAIHELNDTYSEVTRQRHKEIGIQHVRWLIAKDDRVCEICRPMDGERFRVAELERRGWPPRHVRCRCTVIADEEELKEIFKK